LRGTSSRCCELPAFAGHADWTTLDAIEILASWQLQRDQNRARSGCLANVSSPVSLSVFIIVHPPSP
jgi:hypothetical protein